MSWDPWDPWEPSLVSPIVMIIIHPGRFFGMPSGCQCPLGLWQVHYTFNLRDFAKIMFGVLLMKKQDAFGPLGAKHRSTWTLVLTRGWSKCHRQHVNVNRILMQHIWMPLIWWYMVHIYIYIYIHKYIYRYIWGTFGEYVVFPSCWGYVCDLRSVMVWRVTFAFGCMRSWEWVFQIGRDHGEI